MALAVPLLLSLFAGLQLAARSTPDAWVSSAQGPPFVLAWRETAAGARMLEVIPRWADGGAITLSLVDGASPTPRSTVSFAVQAQRPFAWNPLGDRAATGPLRITASWRDPAGRAGGTATAVWPEPPEAAAPAFAPMPAIRLHGIHLDQAITLP